MKRAIGLIAATLVTASIYSQDYGGSTQNPDSTPPKEQQAESADYESRQSEAGAPPSGESSSSSTSGYERSPGTTGGNSSTGQSSGANIGSAADQDQTLTTRDSDVSGSEYRGSPPQSESELSYDSEVSTYSSASSNPAANSFGGSDELKGTGSVDGVFHLPASPVRESSKSEGWSGAGTFSGAGPGSVSGTATSESELRSELQQSIPSPTQSSSDSFNAEVSGNAALSDRDEDLSGRGLEPDSDQLSRTDSELNRVEGDMDADEVLIFEDWTVVRPDEAVGGPAQSESGRSFSDEQYLDNWDRFDSTRRSSGSAMDAESSSGSSMDSDYAQDLYRRMMQQDWSARLGTDIPATPGLMDRTLDELMQMRFYDGTSESSVGGPAGSVSGSSSSSKDEFDCDTHQGSSATYEQGWQRSEDDLDGSVRSSATAIDSDERLENSSSVGGPGESQSGSGSSDDDRGTVRSSGTAIDHDERLLREQRYHINRGEDDKYHINREASGDRSSSDASGSSSAPTDYGERSSASDYDDGHLSGNNAAGSSGSNESSSSTSEYDESSVTPPDR